jgi:ribonuclease BN (tRNA processing enzyme)
MANEAGDRLIFLGTAGARVMVANQILASGGLWLDLSGTEILADPGPGTLVQATKRKLRASKLNGIILSHRHLDHAADINIMIEAMTDGGLRHRGVVFAPQDALNEDPVILHYLQSYVERIEILRQGGIYHIGNIEFQTPLRHQHSVETYGLLFRTPTHTISCITDTKYFDELCAHYQSDLLILNVVRLEPSPYDHLSVPDAAKLINLLKPKAAILTHFGMTMWRAKPWEVAAELSQETGIRVIAARDGMRFDLAQLEGESDEYLGRGSGASAQ